MDQELALMVDLSSSTYGNSSSSKSIPLRWMMSIDRIIVSEYAHYGQGDIKAVELLNGSIPVFNFYGVFSVCYEDDFASPRLLKTEMVCLGLDAHNEAVDG